MNQDLRSILTGTAALTVGAVVSLVLTIRRQPQGVGREQTVRVFLLGLAVQCLSVCCSGFGCGIRQAEYSLRNFPHLTTRDSVPHNCWPSRAFFSLRY